jgi:hypothetical protein
MEGLDESVANHRVRLAILPKVQEKIQQNGLNDVLQKPFKSNELYEIICKNLA